MKTNNHTKKKNENFYTLIFVAMFFVGVCLLIYPTLSDFWNEKRQSEAIFNYDNLIVDLTPEDYSAMFFKADAYNQKLRTMQLPFMSHTKLSDEYYNTLDVNEDGMMGHITIDKIKVQLPIYHGTSDKVLNSAVGHVEGSSLPVGGKSTHSVLSAHRGLPSAKLFTHLDELEIGDVFTLRILDKTLTYQIDQILIVSPEKTDDLNIVYGKDYCTLLTCTPYAINTHRMLVRGVRVDNLSAENPISIMPDAYLINSLIVASFIAAFILGALFIVILFRSDKKGRKQNTKRM